MMNARNARLSGKSIACPEQNPCCRRIPHPRIGRPLSFGLLLRAMAPTRLAGAEPSLFSRSLNRGGWEKDADTCRSGPNPTDFGCPGTLSSSASFEVLPAKKHFPLKFPLDNEIKVRIFRINRPVWISAFFAVPDLRVGASPTRLKQQAHQFPSNNEHVTQASIPCPSPEPE